MGSGKNLSELRKITNFCRKNGIIYYKCDGFEFRISTKALKLPIPRQARVEVPIAGMGETQPMAPLNNLDLMLWSSPTPGFEEPSQGPQ